MTIVKTPWGVIYETAKSGVALKNNVISNDDCTTRYDAIPFLTIHLKGTRYQFPILISLLHSIVPDN